MPSSDEPNGMAGELTRSLSSVWNRYTGTRPSARAEVAGDRVTCVVEDAVADFEAGVAAEALTPANPDRPLTGRTYERDAIATVTRITGRRVLAFVSKHNAKTDIATEVFILDTPRGDGHRPRSAA